MRVPAYRLPQGGRGILVVFLLLEKERLRLERLGVEGVEAGRHPRSVYRALRVPGREPAPLVEIVPREGERRHQQDEALRGNPRRFLTLHGSRPTHRA